VHKCYTGLNQQQVDNHYYANAINLLSVTSIYGITNKIQVLLSDLQQGSTCFMWTSTPIPNKMSIMHSVGRMACTIAFNNPWPFSVIVHKLPHQKIHRSGDIILSQKPSKITVWIQIYVIHSHSCAAINRAAVHTARSIFLFATQMPSELSCQQGDHMEPHLPLWSNHQA